MKVIIGKPPNWVGPYHIAEKILFWKDKNDPIVHKFGEFLARKKDYRGKTLNCFEDSIDDRTWFNKLLSWIHDKNKQKIVIKIDYWDSWSCDDTLCYIIHPLLKKLKETTHRYGAIDKEDVPEYLRNTYGKEEDHASLSKEAYNWVLDEIIWATQPDWDDKYGLGVEKFDSNSYIEYSKRRSNAMRLFGKYYFTFWD